MKRKIFSTLFALVLALSLSMVMAVPAAAATAITITSVTPDTRLAASTSAEYTIVIVTATDLVKGTDTISIEFPTGMVPSATAAAAGDVTINTVDLDSNTTADYLVSGQRLTLTVPESGTLSAGTVTIVIGVTNTKVTNPSAGSYTIDVYTSKDTTPVESAAIIIAGSADALVSITNVDVAPDTVGVVGAYDITLTTQGTTLTANVDTITITFPTGTTVPTSISSASDVTINGVDLDFTTDYSVSGQVVTLTVPADVAAAADKHVIFLVGANITNPTTAGTYGVTAATSQEPITTSVANYDTGDIVAGTGSLLSLTAPTAFSLAPNVATTFTVVATDEYGNATGAGAPTIRFTTSTETGTFDSDPVIRQEAMGSGAVSVEYIESTSGNHTITIKAVPQDTYTNTITQEIVVNPKAALYHGSDPVLNYNTIQAAINAAVPGDTIKVSPGTYKEDITVSEHHLTIESTDGKATTFIEGAMTLNANADNFVLGGTTDKGFTLKKGVDFLIAVEGPTDVTISYNAFDTTRILGQTQVDAIRTGQHTTSGLTVTNNTFTIVGLYDMGVRGHNANYVSGLTVTDNSFTGTDNTLETSAIQIDKLDVSDASLDDTVISGNDITGVTYGVAIGAQGGDLLGDDENATFEISDNTFDGLAYGIWLIAVPNANNDQDVVIKQNTFTGNTKGLAISADADWLPENMTVKYNDFSGNTHGIYNIAASSTALVATHNWWSSVTGPDTTANANDEGDAVSSKVTYSPWLAAAQATVTTAGKPRYAIAVTLSQTGTYNSGTDTWSGGWNTFSTPIWLDGSYDTWALIIASANLTSVDLGSVYSWDGITWGTPTDITPLDAIFVQLKANARSLPIVYSTQLLPAPTKTMRATAGSYTGWELVGQANLTAQHQDITLASISGSYSQVIDPISGNVIADSTDMVVGVGYWVWVTTDSTLAGFTVTPVLYISP